MAYEIPGFKFTLPASADLSASQYCFVAQDTSGNVVIPSTAVDVLGVLCNKPTAAGQAAEIGTFGIYKVRSGAAITNPGTRVMSDSTGRAITVTGATAKAVGIALQSSGAANQVIPVLIIPSGVT